MHVKKGEVLDCHFSLTLNLGIGNYSVCVAVHGGDSHLEDNCDWWDGCLAIQIVSGKEPSFVGVAALPATVSISKSPNK